MDEAVEAARELVERLGKQKQRNRVGLWLAERDYCERAGNIAAQLGIDSEDIRSRYLERLPDGARFSGLTAGKIINLLDDTSQQSGYSNCVLIYNLDLLLAKLGFEDRRNVWHSLWQSFPYRRRALLLLIPDRAGQLVPSASELAIWRREERLAGEITRGSE